MQKLCAEGATVNNAFQLDFQLLWKPRQNSATLLSNQDHVFEPDPAQSWVIQAGLYGQHLSIF
jgi:hypothetical protein